MNTVVLAEIAKSESFTGDNFSIILTAVVLGVLLLSFIITKVRSANENKDPEDTTADVAKDVIKSIFSEERFKTLVQQCIESALDTIVNGSTKEQFVESIKDNICDTLYSFVEAEYPMYTVICSRENIESLADAILDNFGFNEEYIEAAYQEQIGKLNDKTEE